MIIDAESSTELVATPGQTVGPFFGYALPFPGDRELVPPGRADAVRLHGTVTDGAGAAVPDAILELWQADADGRVVQQPGSLQRDGWTFTGWGRASTDDAGHYTFSTLRPGPTAPGRPGLFMITLFARGVTNRLFTRAYLPEDAAALGRGSVAGLAGPRGAGEHDHDRGAGWLPVRHLVAGWPGDGLPALSRTLTARTTSPHVPSPHPTSARRLT